MKVKIFEHVVATDDKWGQMDGIEPKIMGDSLDLHPVTILLALIFWGLVWGPVGMLLAAPSTAVLKIIMERFETTRPAADLLAGRLPEL